ncbi:MAG: PilZ domain-containing protein, partial [Myxococcota bacterium]
RLRLPVGGRAQVHIDGVSGQATLTEISTVGCRLLSPHDSIPGAPIVIGLPPELATGRALKLAGTVVRVEADSVESDKPRFSLAVKFEGTRRSSIESVIRILEGKAIGSLVTRLDPTDDSLSSVEPSEEPKGVRPSRRGKTDARSKKKRDTGKATRSERRNPRGTYRHTLPAIIDQLPHIVVGRDLSTRGMRIDPDSELDLGTTLRVALHRGSDKPPILVEGIVVRDDGGGGLIVSFAEGSADQERALEELTRDLPALESLSHKDDSTAGLVFSSIEVRVASGRGKAAEIRGRSKRRSRRSSAPGRKRANASKS